MGVVFRSSRMTELEPVGEEASRRIGQVGSYGSRYRRDLRYR